MKIIFAGTPPFAARALQALLDSGQEVALVLTRPDRPSGRGMKTVASPVKLLAQQRKLTLSQPDTLKKPELNAQLDAINADVMIVAAYGLLLPSPVLNIPRLGCLNIHASLLPRWRGAAPVERAILAGDRETGITIMQMDRGLDTGAILLQQSLPIAQDDTAQTLHDKLASLGALCIVEALTGVERGTLAETPQNGIEATYAPKLERNEAEIDWQWGAQDISRAVRAFNPRPGAHSWIAGSEIKIWRASVAADTNGEPGEIVAITKNGILVACGEGGLVLEVVQEAGGRKMTAADFLSGHPLHPGDRFESLQ